MAAGDFYFAINATFRFIHDNFGKDALIEYWRSLGDEYYAPLAARFRTGGLDAVADYWRAFFREEPGGDAEVSREDTRVVITVCDCPAVAWLRRHNRDIVPYYCEHCRHVSEAIAENAGLAFELEGGGGSCRQTFSEKSP